MANFKRGKTKKKSHDGDGFNKTKDRDACAAAKGKGVPKKKYLKRFGVERLCAWGSSRSWYKTEKARDAAIDSMLAKERVRNGGTYVYCSHYKKIER